MQAEIVCQGRRLSADQLSWLGQWIGCHPDWSRHRLSRVLSEQWDWRNGRGQFKNFAALSLLKELADRGLIALPAPKPNMHHPRPKRGRAMVGAGPREGVREALWELRPWEGLVRRGGGGFPRRFDAYVQS